MSFAFVVNSRLFCGLSALSAIWLMILFTWALNSNRFLLRLNLNSVACFSIDALVWNCLPFSSSCDDRYPLNIDNSWVTNSVFRAGSTVSSTLEETASGGSS